MSCWIIDSNNIWICIIVHPGDSASPLLSKISQIEGLRTECVKHCTDCELDLMFQNVASKSKIVFSVVVYLSELKHCVLCLWSNPSSQIQIKLLGVFKALMISMDQHICHILSLRYVRLYLLCLARVWRRMSAYLLACTCGQYVTHCRLWNYTQLLCVCVCVLTQLQS